MWGTVVQVHVGYSSTGTLGVQGYRYTWGTVVQVQVHVLYIGTGTCGLHLYRYTWYSGTGTLGYSGTGTGTCGVQWYWYM